jgi:hypothetical protein
VVQQAIQPTPLRGAKLVCILNADSVLMAIPIYTGGAADGQAVVPREKTIRLLLTALLAHAMISQLMLFQAVRG